MGRWTQYDEDEYRLPEGVKRIGYDADSGRYLFRSGGSIWQGPVGAEYGELTKVDSVPSTVTVAGSSSLEGIDDIFDTDDGEDESSGRRGDDVEASPRTRSRGYQLLSDDHNRTIVPRTAQSSKGANTRMGAYRTLFPFFLIIAVLLLLMWRLLISPSLSSPPPASKKCPEGTLSRWVQPGDSCWELAKESGWTLEKFKEVNSKVVCDPLMPGTSICLPPSKQKMERMKMMQRQQLPQQQAKRGQQQKRRT
ncbi:hypothetical protein JR316_0000134 [Psilocybe cubensis]|uniref:LysM domain-containing protein n=2 Tax=Psilocybe cubensis TaxID=181762 RepID=A0A8H7Y4K8_PSICU|nr:hypothetical protein JR316_0000134 [Psilocybe cubensis]KAH9486070.1 hypothetical protein JR316_0000134 [Psilocybe cubensis]